jgi:hypothetical protein
LIKACESLSISDVCCSSPPIAPFAYKQELPPGKPLRVFPFLLQPEPLPLA